MTIIIIIIIIFRQFDNFLNSFSRLYQHCDNVMYLLPIEKVKFQILILSNDIIPPLTSILLTTEVLHKSSTLLLQVQLCASRAAVEGMEVEDGEKRRAIARKDGGRWE